MAWFQTFEYLDFARLQQYSHTLAEKIKQNAFEPDHILYIERVGLFIGIEIAKFYNIGISGIFSQRYGKGIKKKSRFFLRYLPQSLKYILRTIEMKSHLHSIKSTRHVSSEVSLPQRNANILIVDDAIDTGYTLKAVIDYLTDIGYHKKQLKSAVITTTHKNPQIEADISLFKGVTFCFPWSSDSKEYDMAWKRYNALKKSIKF